MKTNQKNRNNLLVHNVRNACEYITPPDLPESQILKMAREEKAKKPVKLTAITKPLAYLGFWASEHGFLIFSFLTSGCLLSFVVTWAECATYRKILFRPNPIFDNLDPWAVLGVLMGALMLPIIFYVVIYFSSKNKNLKLITAIITTAYYSLGPIGIPIIVFRYFRKDDFIFNNFLIGKMVRCWTPAELDQKIADGVMKYKETYDVDGVLIAKMKEVLQSRDFASDLAKLKESFQWEGTAGGNEVLHKSLKEMGDSIINKDMLSIINKILDSFPRQSQMKEKLTNFMNSQFDFDLAREIYTLNFADGQESVINWLNGIIELTQQAEPTTLGPIVPFVCGALAIIVHIIQIRRWFVK